MPSGWGRCKAADTTTHHEHRSKNHALAHLEGTFQPRASDRNTGESGWIAAAQMRKLESSTRDGNVMVVSPEVAAVSIRSRSGQLLWRSSSGTCSRFPPGNSNKWLLSSSLHVNCTLSVSMTLPESPFHTDTCKSMACSQVVR